MRLERQIPHLKVEMLKQDQIVRADSFFYCEVAHECSNAIKSSGLLWVSFKFNFDACIEKYLIAEKLQMLSCTHKYFSN